MNFFSKTWRPTPVLFGLGLHFTLWWAVSIYLWTSFHWKSRGDAIVVLIAPIYFGFFYLRHSHFWALAAVGLLVSITLLGMIALSIRKRQLGLLTHIVVFLCWLAGFALLAIGD